MKIALVYTSTTPELIREVEYEVRNVLGTEIELITLSNAAVLGETRDAGFVTKEAAIMLAEMYLEAMKADVDAILNVCSSVGEAADALEPFSTYCGVPLVRIDVDMCKEAVTMGNRIGVMATLNTTLEPTKNTLKRIASELGKDVMLVDGLVQGAFGLDREQFEKAMVVKAGELVKDVDVILFCQGSMAYCEALIHETYAIPVLSSPRFGALALKEALMKKGVI